MNKLSSKRRSEYALAVLFMLVTGFALDARALDIEVGDRVINLPLPDGVVELTPDMSPYYRRMQAFIGPDNLRYATLVSRGDAEAIQRGEDVELFRYINIESEKAISAVSVSSAKFAELRGLLGDRFGDLFNSAKEKLPDLLDKANQDLSEEISADVAVQLGGLVPLPIHAETDNAIAFSMYMTVGRAVDGSDVGANVVAATTVFLHVKDKVLFVYVYGRKSDLEWTRETAATFASNILEANSSSIADKPAVENSGATGIDR